MNARPSIRWQYSFVEILADENIPAAVVEALRARGHDVVWVADQAPSTGDPSVLALAQIGARLLVTQDKDFGALAYKSRLPAGSGIALVRLTSPSPSVLAGVLVSVLESRTDWAEPFAVIEPGRVRMRSLPER